MINFGFHLNWPWFKNSYECSKDYFYKSWRITKNKTFEFQISRVGNTIIGASFRWDLKCDHAGVMIDIELFRRFLHISLCDNRHWHYEKNRYVNYDERTEVEEYF